MLGDKIKRIKQYVSECKNGYCQECQWGVHPEILQFHHLKNEDKKFMISQAHSKYASKISDDLHELIEEIDKCILLCPNCHQWMHYAEAKGILW